MAVTSNDTPSTVGTSPGAPTELVRAIARPQHHRSTGLRPGPHHGGCAWAEDARNCRGLADGWSSWRGYGIETKDDFYQATRERAELFAELCAARGRDPPSIRHSLVCVAPLTPRVCVSAFGETVGATRRSASTSWCSICRATGIRKRCTRTGCSKKSWRRRSRTPRRRARLTTDNRNVRAAMATALPPRNTRRAESAICAADPTHFRPNCLHLTGLVSRSGRGRCT